MRVFFNSSTSASEVAYTPEVQYKSMRKAE